MPETVEKINIIELEIDQDQALNELTKLHQQITENKNETNALIKANKKLETQGKKNTVTFQNNAKQIEVNKLQVKNLNKEYNTQQKVMNDVLTTSNRELGTLEKLTLRNKELRGELRGLNLETKEGTARQKEIVNEIDANTDVIKENSDQLVQSKMNVGNYTESIEQSIPAFKGMLTGLKQVTRASKAFLSTPIGLILAAAAIGISLLIKGFQRSQRLADEMKISNKGLVASFDVIIDRVSNRMEKAFKRLREDPVQAVKDLGKAIITNLANRVVALPKIFIKAFGLIKNVIKRDKEAIQQSLEELEETFKQLATGLDPAQQKKVADGLKSVRIEMQEEAKAARELARSEIALSDLEIALIGITAKLTKEREKAKLATRDDTLSIEERLAAQDRAIELDKELLSQELSAAKERARISQERTDLGKSSREELRENAELQAEVIRLESAFFTRSKELFSERLSLVNQLRAEEKSRATEAADALKKEAEDLQAFVEQEIEIWNLRNESITEGVETLNDELVAKEGERLDQLESMQIAAVERAFDNALISELDKQQQILQIQAETNAGRLKLEEEYNKQVEDLQEQNATQLFNLEQAALETRLGSQFEVRRNDLEAWYIEQQAMAQGNANVLLQLEETASRLRKQIQQEELNARFSGYQTIFKNIQGIVEEHTVAYKASATAIIAIDTYKSAIASYSSLAGIPVVGPVLGGIAAAAATVAGLSAIRKVLAVNEKSGARSIEGVTGGGGTSATIAIPGADISSSGGLVERELDSQAAGRDTIVEQQQVLIVDQVTADQTDIKEVEVLASV